MLQLSEAPKKDQTPIVWKVDVTFTPQANSDPLHLRIISRQVLFCTGLGDMLNPSTGLSAAEEPLGSLTPVTDGTPPDALLIDLDGQADVMLSLAQMINLQSSDVPVIVISELSSDTQLHQAFRVGAAAYLEKSIDVDTLRQTIYRVAKGERPIDEAMNRRRLL